MRWRGYLVAAVVLGSGAPAYAQYDSRLDELEPEIQAFGHPPLVQSIQGNVESEFARRNDAIEDARADYLQAEGPQSLHEEWTAYHQQQTEQRIRNFEDYFDDAEEIIERDGLGGEQGIHPALLWISRIRQEQFEFQVTIRGMPLARLRDLLEEKTDLYTQALSNLEGEQSTLESNDNGIDSSAKSYRATLLTACTDLRRVKTEADRDLSRASTEILAELTPDQAGEFRDRLRRRIDHLLGDLQLFQTRANTALGQIEAAHGQEMAIVKMVLAKRQTVQATRTSFNLNTAQTQFNDHLDMARDHIDQVRPDGDRDDLEAYVDNAEGDLEPALERFEDAEEEFVDRFEGIFLPPYDSSANERWVEFAEWEDWADDVQGCAPGDLLVNLETSADGRWGARPDTVKNPDARAIVEDALAVEADRLVAAIGAALVEARRLDQASRLEEREVIQDDLNRS
jgi:hypothetical protein